MRSDRHVLSPMDLPHRREDECLARAETVRSSLVPTSSRVPGRGRHVRVPRAAASPAGLRGFPCLVQEGDCSWLPPPNDASSPRKSVASAASAAPHPIPDLTQIQTRSYDAFLQHEVPWQKRKDQGIEGVLREIFPIESYDKTLRLEYLRYELGKPRYEPDECRQLRLTYGRPFKVWLRLTKEQPIEEEVYLGDIPIMLGGGEFIINGAERVVVSQLHRSPGVDFVMEVEGAGERRLHSCRIIPERGSWIELNVTRKESLAVRIDQSGKFSIMTLLRAMDPKYGEDAALLRVFYPTEKVKVVDGRSAVKIEGKLAVGDIVYPADSPRAGEVLVECGQKITKNAAEQICTSGLTEVEVMADPKNPLLLNSLAEDATASHEEALLRIYQRLRPGNPPNLEKAKALFHREVLRHQPLPAGPRGPVPHQPQAGPEHRRRRDDAAARGPHRRHPVPAASCGATTRRRRSTTSTTWATAACGRSTSWPATSCARASSSSAAPCRSG